jgi:UDP-N-acetyl-D-glucosamine/UDP-N-acetyl-D-galactosamine dehydrogenase
MNEKKEIAVIGLGYVGLPLAVEFGKKRPTTGFDIQTSRIDELRHGRDRTLEVSETDLAAAVHLTVTADIEDIRHCRIFIVAVPTPIDRHSQPDLRPLLGASGTVGSVLKKGDIVVFESTVYPGCTEEDCVPVLERESGLQYNKDFFCGYSPERINPGDKKHTLRTIKKVVSGSTDTVAQEIQGLYEEVVDAGVFVASSIKVAEAAKVIENAQRDINIAFVNELSKIFQLLDIDTLDVLEAAGTKWNFLPFRPGLVGGHCIGVDPFYLAHKAQEHGYYPEIILGGRRINDGMGEYVASEVVKLLIQKGHRIKGARVLALGITFKENCPDTRNSRSIDVVRALQEYGCTVDVYDPWADREEVQREYDIELVPQPEAGYAAIVLTVSHAVFADLNIKELTDENSVVFDAKGLLPRNIVDRRL